MIELGRLDHGFMICKLAGARLNRDYDIIISCSEDEEFLGGMVFYDFTGIACAVHIGAFSPHWLDRNILWVCFHHVFNNLGCSSLFAQIRSRNHKVLEMARKIGFKVETVIPEVFPDGDMIICRMRPPDCKWLKIKPRDLRIRGAQNG